MLAHETALLVKTSILEALASGAVAPSFRERIETTLKKFPHPLHERTPLRPTQIALGAFFAGGGKQLQVGAKAAAATEVIVSASHVFDALADHDRHSTNADQQIGPALLFLASHLFEASRAASGLQVDWSQVYSSFVTACSGQQADLDLQGNETPSLEEAKEMTEAKAGAIGKAIALAAGASTSVTSELAAFGLHFGTYSQLLDDASDASTLSPGTSDIALKKKTVPIAYFLHAKGDSPELDACRSAFNAGGMDPTGEMQVRIAIETAGAIRFTLTLAHWYRMRAEAILERLEKHGCQTRLLRSLLEDKPKDPREPQANPPLTSPSSAV